jgi:hypothetical protein
VNSDILHNFLSEVDLINIDFSLFQNIKNGLTEFKLPILQELTERWKEPPAILPESQMKEIIEMLGEICESKENISKQLKGFVAQHKFYEELILAQNKEIKLLKKKIRKQSQKDNNHFAQIDSKLDLILQTIGKSNESTSQEIATLKKEIQKEISEKKGEISASITNSADSIKKDVLSEITNSADSIKKEISTSITNSADSIKKDISTSITNSTDSIKRCFDFNYKFS